MVKTFSFLYFYLLYLIFFRQICLWIPRAFENHMYSYNSFIIHNSRVLALQENDQYKSKFIFRNCTACFVLADKTDNNIDPMQGYYFTIKVSVGVSCLSQERQRPVCHKSKST